MWRARNLASCSTRWPDHGDEYWRSRGSSIRCCYSEKVSEACVRNDSWYIWISDLIRTLGVLASWSPFARRWTDPYAESEVDVFPQCFWKSLAGVDLTWQLGAKSLEVNLQWTHWIAGNCPTFRLWARTALSWSCGRQVSYGRPQIDIRVACCCCDPSCLVSVCRYENFQSWMKPKWGFKILVPVRVISDIWSLACEH